MSNSSSTYGPVLAETQRPAIRFLVESALRALNSKAPSARPRTRDQWVGRLCQALMAEGDRDYQSVIKALIASGVRPEDVYQSYVPSAARFLGELWVSDRASFVDVTIGASRLQSLFRSNDLDLMARAEDRSIPLGQSVLMVMPEYEQHALGAFVIADNLRRHGLWVHMAIGLKDAELAELIRTSRFAMIGISLATRATVEKTTGLVDYIRSQVEYVPPIVIGGRVVNEDETAVMRTGADFAVKTAREAIERCGLSSVAEAIPFAGIK
ncbi:MAG: cobalamin B12-binding domain-containing protein [Pseudomonadota bacterium]